MQEVVRQARRAIAQDVASATAARAEEAPASGGVIDMFEDVPAAVRMQLELIARASVSADAALLPAIDLLVPGEPAKRDAIVTAISSNDPLREQWERAWETLRS